MKLVISLGIGALLIFLVFKNMSKPNTITFSSESSETNHVFDNWKEVERDYYRVGDTLAFFQTVNEEKRQAIIANSEGYLIEKKIKKGESLQIDQEIAVVQLNAIEVLENAFKRTNYFWIILSMVFAVLAHFSRAVRWRMLLKSLNYEPKLSNTFYAIGVMYLGNLAFPRLGEILRCSILARYEDIPVNKSVGTMITERIVDVISLGALMVFTILFQYKIFEQFFVERIYPLLSSSSGEGGMTKYIILGAIGLIGLLVFYLIQSGKIKLQDKISNVLKGLIDGVKSIRYVESPALFVLHSILIWAFYLAMIGVCIYALPETAKLTILSSFPLMFFGAFAIIFVQGGIGIYPMIIAQVLLLYGVSYTDGYAFGWVAWTGQTLLILVLGVVSFLLLNFSKTKKEVHD